MRHLNPYVLLARKRDEEMAERARKAHEEEMNRRLSPITCHNCGGHAPGPWLVQWRAEHPRSQREACRLKMWCLYTKLTDAAAREALWNGDESVLLSGVT